MQRECFDVNKLLWSNDKIGITKPDKGSGVIILNKSDYIIKTNLILDDVGKFQQINPVWNNDNTAKIKSFIILVVLRRSVKRVDGAHLHVIGPGSTASFEEISQRRQAVGNTVSNLTGPRF